MMVQSHFTKEQYSQKNTVQFPLSEYHLTAECGLLYFLAYLIKCNLSIQTGVKENSYRKIGVSDNDDDNYQ